MTTTTPERQAATPPRRERGSPANRDDLFTLIHKALRYGLLTVAIDAGSTDWSDAAAVAELRKRWTTVEHLLRSHAGHEDRHIFALLESKQPGAVEELGIGHAVIERELGEVAGKLGAAFETGDPAAGLDAYRALTHLVGTATSHFADEEPVVMERLWGSCTDDEIAACRAAFMAEITPEDAMSTYELMFPATSAQELVRLLGAVRAGVPELVFAALMEVAERTLVPAQVEKIRAQVEAPSS